MIGFLLEWKTIQEWFEWPTCWTTHHQRPLSFFCFAEVVLFDFILLIWTHFSSLFVLSSLVFPLICFSIQESPNLLAAIYNRLARMGLLFFYWSFLIHLKSTKQDFDSDFKPELFKACSNFWRNQLGMLPPSDTI